jgi:hypothetical protein
MPRYKLREVPAQLARMDICWSFDLPVLLTSAKSSANGCSPCSWLQDHAHRRGVCLPHKLGVMG